MAVNQSMINSHLKTHSSARPYVCRYPSCNFKCKFSTQLRSHCEKKHGEQTSRNRKSSVRRSRGYVQNSVVDQVMTTTNSSLDTVSPVSGKAVSVSPSGDSSLLHDAATNWAMAAAAAASVWSPHLAAASSLFGGLPFVPGQTTSPLHNESLMAKGPLISSPFHQHSGYKTTVNSSPAQVVPFGQFSPLTAKIGAMQFGSPVAAARALNLQHTTANVSGRNREPAALPILHDVMPESCPRNDQRSPSHRVDDHCVLASASASAAHPGPSHSSSFKKEIRSSSTHSDSASCQIPRPTQLSTSENCDVAPLDLTKKPSVVCRESRRICEDRKSPTSITKTNLIVSEITSDSQFRKPSRRKGIAHKLDVVSANLYAVEDDVVEVETVKHLASSTAAGTKMAAEVNLSLDLSKTRSELSVSSFAADSRENKGRDHADVTADQNGSPTSRVRRVLVETGGNHGNDARSTVGKDCPYCDCVFHYSVMHAIHMEFHGPPEDPWKCNKCGIRCVDRVDFNDHIATVAHH
jgi:hypothetical protein